ncbi:MAG: 16S rRNA (uracil(1498)-N(3))-methyltransferase [Luminiphilus sp.]|nr:16S rRNA (uracil(1498)-N(3))-methyltransferase [Luminiphilus sp.]
MRHYRVYSDAALAVGAQAELDKGAAKHLVAVLRVGLGDAITVFNGDGFNYLCSVIEITKLSLSVSVISRSDPENESNISTTLGLAVSKGDRFDWAIKKATELGVTAIAPLLTQRVDVRLPPDRWAKKRSHWQQVVIAACEQSGRAFVPTVRDAKPLASWLPTVDADSRFVLDPRAVAAAKLAEKPDHIALLIGPEGGLTNEEFALAKANGFVGLSLGPRIMRTETAPIAALSIIGAKWGDLNSFE